MANNPNQTFFFPSTDLYCGTPNTTPHTEAGDGRSSLRGTAVLGKA